MKMVTNLMSVLALFSALSVSAFVSVPTQATNQTSPLLLVDGGLGGGTHSSKDLLAGGLGGGTHKPKDVLAGGLGGGTHNPKDILAGGLGGGTHKPHLKC